MQQESAQELVDRQRHQTLLVLVSGIAPAKSDHAIGKGDESMVGNRYPMSVLPEITKRVLGTAERAFCVNHPLGAEQRTQPRGEGFRILQRGECSMEGEFVLRMHGFQAIHELSAEHFLEHFHRQEELLLRVDPPRVVRRQTAGWNDAVDMWVEAPTPTIP